MPVAGSGLRFQLEWRITLFTLVLVSLMTGLGFWQLQRAEEKAALAASWEFRQNQPPVAIESLWHAPAATLAYVPVRLSGVFDPDKFFLLDNRVNAGRFGYEVLGIVQLDGGQQRVLVNRGWLPGDPARLELPVVPAVMGRVELVGHVYVAPGTPYLLGEQQLGDTWPKLLQAVEMDKVGAALGAPVADAFFRYPVRIAAGQPGALAVDWQVVNMSPDKHRAYAAQWFTMALVLLLFYLFRSSNLWQWIKRKDQAGY